jgi:hypothetical protein
MITTIKDELKWYIKSYKDDYFENNNLTRLLTETQKKNWPLQNGLILAQLGNDHENPLVLPREDGYDGDTIFRKGFKSVVQHYTQDNDNKRFPEPDGLIRFGLFFHLNLFQIIVLLLKNEWEKYFIKNVWCSLTKKTPDNPDEIDTASYLSCLMGYESTLIAENYNFRFSKDMTSDDFSEWATCLDNYGLIEKYQVNAEQLQSIAGELVKAYFFLRPTWSKQVVSFSENQFKLLGVLSEQELELKESYWIKKGSFQVLEMNLGELLYLIETLKIEHFQIDNDWFKHFGENHLYILSLQLEESLLEDKMNLNLDPSLTEDQIEQLLAEKKAAKLEELKKLKEKMDDQAWIAYVENSETKILLGDELEEYKKQCKVLLSQIFKLTHPDKSKHYPFTSKQRAFLVDWFQEAMTIKKRDPDYILRTIQVSRLHRILNDVQALYLSLGETIETDKEMKNASLNEQIDIYERRIQQLERDIHEFQNELNALQNNKDIAEKKFMIASSNAISRYQKEQENRIEELKQKIQILQNQPA